MSRCHAYAPPSYAIRLVPRFVVLPCRCRFYAASLSAIICHDITYAIAADVYASLLPLRFIRVVTSLMIGHGHCRALLIRLPLFSIAFAAVTRAAKRTP